MEESFLAEFARRAVTGPCRLAFDIGANRGEWTEYLARHFARVVALEPDARAFRLLKEHLPAHAIAVPSAVAERDGTATLFQRPDALQSSLLEIHPIGGQGQAPAPIAALAVVPTRSIASLVCQFGPPDFIKIDCEGGETAVMAGMTPESIQGTRLLIEIHDTADAVERALHRLGRTRFDVMRHPLPGTHPGHCWFFSDPPAA